MLQGPGEGKLSVPRLPCVRGERLNGKVVSEGLLKFLVQLQRWAGIPVVLDPEAGTFRRISQRCPGPYNN